MIKNKVARYITAGLMVFFISACRVPDGFKERSEFVQTHLINNPDLMTHYINEGNFRLHYRAIGQAKKAIVIWVHGTPGSWTDGAYLTRNEGFLSQVKVVMVERPGWGESQFQQGSRPVTSFKEIGRLMQPLLRQLNKTYPGVPLVLVGFSWGGSVVPSIALDYPNLVDSVLVLSGGLDPALTKPRWYHKLARTFLINAIIGDGLRKANVEMYALSPELSILHERWPKLSQPIVVIQGDSDKLVDAKNANYAESVLSAENSTVITLKNQGHMLQLERMNLIERCVIALAQGDLGQCT
ncbi:MAG: alpha/beta hydrolase [Gammaproteobacteria bacterium]|nr:alpha/beta hydrolase [Gammaproteobacteria bacterium]